MLYWLEIYDDQNNNTKTIEIFKSYICNENSRGSDWGALPVSTRCHVAQPSPAGGRRNKMGVVTEVSAHSPSAIADAWPSPRLREADARRWGSDGGVRPLPVSTR